MLEWPSNKHFIYKVVCTTQEPGIVKHLVYSEEISQCRYQAPLAMMKLTKVEKED